MTPEGKVKKQLIAILKEHGANVYYFSPVTGGFGRSGVPDVVACVYGFFVGIECKAGDKEPTALQHKNLGDIIKAWGYSVLFNGSDHSLKFLNAVIDECKERSNVETS
jgi:Holliday junction resolvase